MAKSKSNKQHSIREIIRDFFDVSKGRASYSDIKRRVIREARIDGVHAFMLAIAMLIACVGLNTNSTEAVIGAMLICPLMGSVIAIAYSVASLDGAMFRRSLLELGIQMAVCLVTSTLYFVITPITLTTAEITANSSPTAWEIILGFAGGFAGGIGLTRKSQAGTLLAGVAVATSLMPPLCATGFGIAVSDAFVAASALYKFLINVTFIAFGAQLVMAAIRVPTKYDLNNDGIITREERMKTVVRGRTVRTWLVICTILFALPCLVLTYFFVRNTQANYDSHMTTIDFYETRDVSQELMAVFPEIVDYGAGYQDKYLPNENLFDERITAVVTCDPMLSAESQERATLLIKNIAKNVENVQFVDASQQAGATTSDSEDQTLAGSHAQHETQGDKS